MGRGQPRAIRAAAAFLLGLWALVGGLGGAATPVQARPGGERGRIERLLRQSMDLYDRLDFDKALNRLQEAYGIAEKAGLERDPLAAKILVALGIVYASGLKEHEKAVQVFQRAGAIDPDVELDASLATPDVKAAWDEARGAGRPKGGGTKAPALSLGSGQAGAEGAPSGGAGGQTVVNHTPVEEAPRGEPIVVLASVSGLKAGSKVVLRWREQSEHSFEQDTMVRRGDRYEAQVPASATDHDWLEYFIEVRDGRGAVVTTQGTERNPLLCTLIASKAPAAQKSDSGPGVDGAAGEPAPADDGDDSLPPRKGPSGEELLTKDEATDVDSLRKGRASFWRSRTYLAALSVGTGIGFVSGETEVVNSQVHCCLASAPLHISPELGVQLNESWQISLVGRLQVLTTANVETSTLQPARGAIAAMLRARYGGSGSEGGAFTHLDVGGGEIRHVINVEDQQNRQTKNDTVRAGSFLFGFGAGYRYALSSRLAAVFDASLLFFAPAFSANLDLSLGASVSF
jgi:hypothetical protein